jgi:high-affinity iron transporter
MGKNLFSVPIFFIVFRETIEGALILAILLGLAHQIGHNTRSAPSTRTTGPGDTELDSAPRDENRKTAGRLARKLKIQAC